MPALGAPVSGATRLYIHCHFEFFVHHKFLDSMSFVLLAVAMIHNLRPKQRCPDKLFGNDFLSS